MTSAGPLCLIMRGADPELSAHVQPGRSNVHMHPGSITGA
jgi:hypothetical protein